MQITSVRQTEAAGVETASRNRSVPLTGTGPSGVGGHRQVQPPHGHVMAMASHRAAPPHNTTHPGSRPVARNDRRPAATPAVHQLPDRTLRRPCRPTEAHALRVVHDAFGWGLCCSVASGSVSAGLHPPPLPHANGRFAVSTTERPKMNTSANAGRLSSSPRRATRRRAHDLQGRLPIRRCTRGEGRSRQRRG